MRFANLNIVNLIGGGLFIAIGAYTILESSGYPIGQLNRMGPGYLPLVLGIVLVGLGIGIALQRPGPSRLPALQLRALLAISGAVIGFGIVAERFGIVPATFVVVVISSLADPRLRPIATLSTAVGLAVFTYIVFIEGLGVSMRAFSWG